MWTRWSKLCTFLLPVALASSGCHGTSGKGGARPPARHDAGRDCSLGDPLVDSGAGAVTPDLATDLFLDIDSRELGPDVLSDGAPGLPHDLGTGVGDAGLDSPLDLANPRDLDGGWAADLPVAPPRDGAVDLPLHAEPDVAADAGPWTCTSGQPSVLVLSGNKEGGLYWFDPDNLALGRIGTVSCGTNGELNSLAVLPGRPAYVSNVRGELCVVDLTTRVASPTSFDAVSIANQQYGMAVVPDSVPMGQTLYIAVRSAGQADTLARVDLSTFALATIGPIELHQDGGTQPFSGIELTASTQGGLYGFGVGTAPALLLAIDPKTGNAVKMTEVPVVNPAGFALVEWRGAIYLFFAESGARGSTVFTFHTRDAQVSRIGDIETAVIGAGVATCP